MSSDLRFRADKAELGHQVHYVEVMAQVGDLSVGGSKHGNVVRLDVLTGGRDVAAGESEDSGVCACEGAFADRLAPVTDHVVVTDGPVGASLGPQPVPLAKALDAPEVQ